MIVALNYSPFSVLSDSLFSIGLKKQSDLSYLVICLTKLFCLGGEECKTDYKRNITSPV